MELDAVDRLRLVAHRGDRDARARCRDDVARRRYVDVVAMTHPRGQVIVRLESGEQTRRLTDVDLRPSILPPSAGDDLSTRDVRDELHAVAHAKHRRDIE